MDTAKQYTLNQENRMVLFVEILYFVEACVRRVPV